eukprot:gene12725-15049_t
MKSPPAPPETTLEEEEELYAPLIGRRTTFRLLNRKHGLKLAPLGEAPNRTAKYRPADDKEAFVFWHHGSIQQASSVAGAFAQQRLYFLSADLLDWSVAVYSALRADMHGLGAGPSGCYAALSSGMHGVLLAIQLCQEVNLYGFSLSKMELEKQVHFRPIRERPSQAHDWDFDALVYRLLHIAGRIQICGT